MLPFVPTPADREQARLQARQRARELAVSMGLRSAEPAGKQANEQEQASTPVAADQPTLMGMPVVWFASRLRQSGDGKPADLIVDNVVHVVVATDVAEQVYAEAEKITTGMLAYHGVSISGWSVTSLRAS